MWLRLCKVEVTWKGYYHRSLMLHKHGFTTVLKDDQLSSTNSYLPNSASGQHNNLQQQ